MKIVKDLLGITESEGSIVTYVTHIDYQDKNPLLQTEGLLHLVSNSGGIEAMII